MSHSAPKAAPEAANARPSNAAKLATLVTSALVALTLSGKATAAEPSQSTKIDLHPKTCKRVDDSCGCAHLPYQTVDNREQYLAVANADFAHIQQETLREKSEREALWKAAQEQWNSTKNQLSGKALLEAELKYRKEEVAYYNAMENYQDLQYMILDARYLGHPSHLGVEGSQPFYEDDKKKLSQFKRNKPEYSKAHKVIAIRELRYIRRAEEASNRVYDIQNELANM